MVPGGTDLLQAVAERIVMGWLRSQGHPEVSRTGGLESFGGRSVDITYGMLGGQRRIKVKSDPYFGTDNAKIADRSLSFYREDAGVFAFEAMANTATREPGWVLQSSADDLYYYFLAISQPEIEVKALFAEPDEVLFSELAVDRDELVVMPMAATQRWFEANAERFTPRPVMSGGTSAWYRLVPRVELESSIPGLRRVGGLHKGLAR